MIVLPLNELNFFFSILQYSLFSFPLKGFSFGLKSSRCVCVCCIELTVGITIYEIEKNSYHLLSHRAVWIRWNMSLWMFLSNLDWSFFIFFYHVYTHCMLWNEIDPTNLLDTHCVFNAGAIRLQGCSLEPWRGSPQGGGDGNHYVKYWDLIADHRRTSHKTLGA